MGLQKLNYADLGVAKKIADSFNVINLSLKYYVSTIIL